MFLNTEGILSEMGLSLFYTDRGKVGFFVDFKGEEYSKSQEQ